MTYILYSHPDCASHVIRMALEELDLPYRDQDVDMVNGAQHSEEYLRLNPRGMVPALADPETDMTMAETGAILNYLSDVTGDLAPAPSDAAKRAEFLQRLYFLSNTLHADAQIQYYTHWYVGDAHADTVRPTLHARMRKHFAMIEDIIATHGGPWLLGEQLTVCDFYLGGCARWSLIAPRHDPLEPEAITQHPHLNALLDRLENRESVIRAYAAEGTPRSSYFRAPVRSRFTADRDG